MAYDFFNLSNLVLGFGLLVLFLATCLLFTSFTKSPWVGITIFAIYYLTLQYGGFPLGWLFLINFPIELNGGPQSGKKNLVKLLIANLLFIIQWIIWWMIIKFAF